MTVEYVMLRGERYVTLTTVAACYRVEVTVVREAYEYGLLGEGEVHEGEVAVPASRMGVVARILRLRASAGVNVEGIVLLVRRGLV